MGKKRMSAEISKRILQRINSDSTELEQIIKDYIDRVEMDEREKFDLVVDEETHKKIRKIKNATNQPQWKIIERILQNYLANKKEEKDDKKEQPHIEPEMCPECQANSDELLISHANYTWYCHNCGEEGEY